MKNLFKNIFNVVQPITFVDEPTMKQTVYNFNILASSKDFIVKTFDVVTKQTITSTITKQGFLFDSLCVPYPVTANTIFATLLAELYDNAYEQKLQNDYNAANIGLEVIGKKQKYLDFLQQRKDLRLAIEADCLTGNIPIS